MTRKSLWKRKEYTDCSFRGIIAQCLSFVAPLEEEDCLAEPSRCQPVRAHHGSLDDLTAMHDNFAFVDATLSVGTLERQEPPSAAASLIIDVETCRDDPEEEMATTHVNAKKVEKIIAWGHEKILTKTESEGTYLPWSTFLDLSQAAYTNDQVANHDLP